MHVISMRSTIVASSDQAVLQRGNTALPKIALYSHPAGTVLDIEDNEARDLISRGIVERYDRMVHGDEPAQSIARQMASGPQQSIAGAGAGSNLQRAQ